MAPRRVLLAAMDPLVCVLGGCTAMGPVDPTGTAIPESSVVVGDTSMSPTTTVVDSSAAVIQGSYVTEMTPPPPLAKYGVYLDGPGEDEVTTEAREQRHNTVQEAIAVCMADQGFRYLPVPFQAVSSLDDNSKLSLSLSYLLVPSLSDDRETVVNQGYGVMSSPMERVAEAGRVEDPNLAYTQTLGAVEYEAFNSALYGDYLRPTETSGDSCSGKAVDQFPEQTQVIEADSQRRFEAEFADLVYALRTGIDLSSDDRVIQLDAEWDSCMIRNGFDLERVEGEHGPRLALDRALRTRSDGSVRQLTNEPVNAADIPVEEQSLMGTEAERAVALADYDCRVETDYMARITKIRFAMDEAFIAEHQAELDRLVATADSW